MPPGHSNLAIIVLVPTRHSEHTPVRFDNPGDAWLALAKFAHCLRQFYGRPGWQPN